YLVGGIVRDQLLARPLRDDADIDLTTDARPPAIKALVAPLASAVWTQGERFGTIGCTIGGRSYEITTHRGEAYEPHSRKPVVAFADSITEDLSRRDFTVNAMAAEVPGGRLIDPFGGAADLSASRLATPLSPEASFGDDPLRMLRAARFIAGYGLDADGALVKAVRAMAERMSIGSAERRRDELDKLLTVDAPSRGLWFLVDTGLVAQVLSGFAARDLATVARAVDRVAALPVDRRLRLA